MELDYEQRSKKLLERLDRVQNYLKSLPPLPKVGTTSEALKVQSKEWTEVLSSASSQLSNSSAESVESSAKRRSVSTRPSKMVARDCNGQLLQRIPSYPSNSPSPETSNLSSYSASSGLGNPIHSGRSPATSDPAPIPIVAEVVRKKKRRRREPNKIQDPMRPTERRSFGVDIGQGINVINYIKQNAVADSEYRRMRLTKIITREGSPGLNERSGSRINRQGVSESSSASMFRNRDSETVRHKHGKRTESPSYTLLQSHSDTTNMYRVRYIEKAEELPHHHGLDALQELFVPYVEHDPYTDPEHPTTNSDIE